MNKKLIAFTLVILAILSTLTACTNNNTNETTPTTNTNNATTTAPVTFATVDEVPATITNEDAQYQLLAERVNTWKLKDFDTTDTPESFKYAVTDLDNDGKLEVMSSVCTDSSHSTTSHFYEVNEDCTDLVARHETAQYSEDSEPDFTVDSTDCFINPETMERSFIYQNSLTYSGEEILLNKGYFTLLDSYLDNRSLTTKMLSGGSIIFKDFDDNVLTEDEFNNFTDTYFAGYAKLTATFGWTEFVNADGITAADLTTDELINNLKASFAEFSVK